MTANRIQPRAIWPATLILWAGMGVVYGAEIQGPDRASPGEIVVFTADIEPGSRYRWILPDGIEPVARTATQIALILEPGTAEIILVEANTSAILVARLTIQIDAQGSRSHPPAPKTKVATSEARPPPEAKGPVRAVPMVVMYGRSSPPCPACDKWMAEQHPELLGTNWRFSKINNSKTVSVYPSFEIQANGQTRYFTGYLTAAQIKTEVAQMEAEQ